MAAAKVLVVDDETMVRELSSLVLRRSGYDVTAAPDGEKALAILRGTSPASFDLVLSDAVMPSVQGLELREAVREISPSTAFVLMSAYPQREMPDGIAFLRKPFTPKALIAAVERTLSETAQARPAVPAAVQRSREILQDARKGPPEH